MQSEFTKLRALHAFVPSRFTRLRALRALIFTRLARLICYFGALFTRDIYSSQVVSVFSELFHWIDVFIIVIFIIIIIIINSFQFGLKIVQSEKAL